MQQRHLRGLRVCQSLVIEIHSLQQKRQELDVAAAGPTFSLTKASPPRGSRGEGLAGAPSENAAASASAAALDDWSRVEELYQTCEEWKTPSAMLPSLLRRLHLLKNLHRQAGGLGLRIQSKSKSLPLAASNRRERERKCVCLLLMGERLVVLRLQCWRSNKQNSKKRSRKPTTQ